MSLVTIGTYGSYYKMLSFGFSEKEVEKYLEVFNEDSDNFNKLVLECSKLEVNLKESRKFILGRTIEEHPLRYFDLFKPDNYKSVFSYVGLI